MLYVCTVSCDSDTCVRVVTLQAFSTPWFLYANPTNHHLVFFLLEVFNNIIQYQFDGLTLATCSLQTHFHESLELSACYITYRDISLVQF